MLSHEKATSLNTLLIPKGSKLFYPPQNLVDSIWKEKPARSKEPVFVQPMKLAGMEAGAKIAKLRGWIKSQPPSVPSYSKSAPTPAQMQEAMLISNLSSVGEFPTAVLSRRHVLNYCDQRGCSIYAGMTSRSILSSTHTCSFLPTSPSSSSKRRRSRRTLTLISRP